MIKAIHCSYSTYCSRSNAAAVGNITSGAVTFSGDLNSFANNLTELTQTLGIPVEQVQTPQP